MRSADVYLGRGAELYDKVVQGDKSEVREILHAVGRGRAEVLEIAAGSGRLTVALAAISAHLTALDLSEDLLSILADRLALKENVTPVVADILTWNGPRKVQYDAIVIGTSSIALFDEEQRGLVFRRAYDWLRYGGVLVLTLRYASGFPGTTTERILTPDISVSEMVHPDGARVTQTLVEHTAGGLMEYDVRSWRITPQQLCAELERSGFSDIACRPVSQPQGSPQSDTHVLMEVRK